MDDDVLDRISVLVDEEHDLVGKASPGEPLSEADEVRLGQVEIRLDQCWDLLRQRLAPALTPGSIPATQRFAVPKRSRATSSDAPLQVTVDESPRSGRNW